MVPAPSDVRRRAVLATAGAGLSGLAGCNFGYLGDTSSDRPPLWGDGGGERVAIAPDENRTVDYQSPPWL